jgi:hypothetical protein
VIDSAEKSNQVNENKCLGLAGNKLMSSPGFFLSRRTVASNLILAASFAVLSGCKTGSGSGDEQEADPVVVDLPIAYIQRTLPIDDQGDPATEDILLPTAFNPGARVFLKDRATPSAAAVDITQTAFSGNDPYDVKGLEVSSDGQRLLFSMRAPEIPGLDEEDQPTWNIWEYELSTNNLRRIITSDINAEGGQDLDPVYLPDGRIVFSSNRQRRSKAILLDDNKPQFAGLEEDLNDEALVLHVMEPDGTNIQQLTFNQSHDLQPTVLNDGRILFNRWDNIANRDNISLYTVNPDGSGLSLHYGYHSQDTGTNNIEAAFFQPRQSPDGRILISLKPRQNDRYGGDIVLIDGENFTDINQPVYSNTGASGPGQQSSALLEVTIDGSPSPHGQFSAAFPFNDGTDRLLVSWSQCRVINPDNGLYTACTDSLLATPNIQLAPPLYGLWVYNLENQSQQPLIQPEEGIMYSEAVTMEPTTAPTFIPEPVIGVDVDATLVSEGVGVLHIRSVYDLDGTDTTPAGISAMADPQQTPVDQRPARFLRIIKAVAIPDDDLVDLDNSDFGRSRAQLMREIIGYLPIEPDGSVKAKIPADIAFTLEVVDSEGKRIGERHQNWLQLRPGEEQECRGCHSSTSELPHGRLSAQAPSVNNGSLANGIPFPNSEPALFADLGESMAETYSRINGIRSPSVDIIFDDEWTDDSGALSKEPSFAYRYSDLSTAAPVTAPCQTNWTSLCRTIIHYEDHIHPIWEVNREVLDINSNVIDDHTCTLCHNTRDNNNVLQVPDAQLDLTGAASPDEADHLISYRELLFNDAEQELDINGALVDRLVQATDGNGNPLFQTDSDGNQILDINGDPIPIMVTVNVNAAMSTNGALSSPRFFAPFAAGGSHEDYLTDAELKLISEWLDIGAQYYNNPFDVPIN